MAKLSNKTIAENVLIEGLDHAILQLYTGRTVKRFADPILAERWLEAHEALVSVMKILGLEDTY